jgi:hypothetical protein
MNGCGPDCQCRDTSTADPGANVRLTLLKPEVQWKQAEQPEGWHVCLKQKTRCIIRTYGVLGREQRFEATNSCHVENAEICPRVTAGSKSGEGYELCGPPNHAEQEAAKLLLETFPEGAPSGSTAYLYGHTWLCMDCQHALTAAGVTTFVVTGEPA